MTHEQYLKLVDSIIEHNRAYYVKDEPTISDSEYDALFRELEEYEQDNPKKIVSHSPTNKVGFKPSPVATSVKLLFPMLSLKDIFTKDKFLKWETKRRKDLKIDFDIDYCCELKLDGLALDLTYDEKGKLIEVTTRGDGQIGESVFRNVKHIDSIVKQLEDETSMSVRGELFITNDAFEEINSLIAPAAPYVSQRNAAAGIIRQLKTPSELQNQLIFNAFDIADSSKDRDEQMKYLMKQGFDVAPYMQVVKGAEGVIEYYDKIMDIRDELGFGIDGIVVKVNEREYSEQLGNGNRYPNHACAFKFPAAAEMTEVDDIVFSVTRNGTISTVVKVIPIAVGDVTISNVTIGSAERFDDYNIHLGDMVTVERAGDVVPAIVKVHEELRSDDAVKIDFIKECPSCGGELVREGKFVICPNTENCPEQKLGKFENFVSKNGMDIRDFGSSRLSDLLEENCIDTFADIYTLHERASDVRSKVKITNHMWSKTMAAIEQSKDVQFSKFLYAIDIPTVGRQLAINIAKHFKTIEAFMAADLEKISEVKDIHSSATHVYEFITGPKRKIILDLLSKGINVK